MRDGRIEARAQETLDNKYTPRRQNFPGEEREDNYDGIMVFIPDLPQT